MSRARGLTDLPEDIILNILKNLSSIEIINVGMCNKLLWRVAHDHTLWETANFMEGGHRMTQMQARIALGFVCYNTKAVYLQAKATPRQVFLKRMMRQILSKSPHLRILEIHDWNLTVVMREYPRRLWRLSLSGSKPAKYDNIKEDEKTNRPSGSQQNVSYFYGICTALPCLQSLDLSRCTWLDSHSLLALSKSTHLRELVLNGCSKMGGCVAYSALATGMGFNALERLDVRYTLMEDVDLKNFLSKPNIDHLLVGTEMQDGQDPKFPLSEADMETYFNLNTQNNNISWVNALSEFEGLMPDFFTSASDSESDDEDIIPMKIARVKLPQPSTSGVKSKKKKTKVKNTRSSSKLQKPVPSTSKANHDSAVVAGGSSETPELVVASSETRDVQEKQENNPEPSVHNFEFIEEETLPAKPVNNSESCLHNFKFIEEEVEVHSADDVDDSSNHTDKDDEKFDDSNENAYNFFFDPYEKRDSRPSSNYARMSWFVLTESEDSMSTDDEDAPLKRYGGRNMQKRLRDYFPLRLEDESELAREANACVRTKRRRVLTNIQRHCKLWAPWKYFDEHLVSAEAQRDRVARRAEHEDYEEFLEENGRNVIVLNCMADGIQRTTHLYNRQEFLDLTKSTSPGAYVTDELLNYPLPCIKLKVLSVAGCTQITDKFLRNLTRLNFKELQLLDLRHTSVTQAGIDRFVEQSLFPVRILH